MKALLSIKDLNTFFKTKEGEVHAVCNVNLSLEKGKIFGLIGETGCGKSVLGNSILKLLPDNACATGEIIFEDKNILRLSSSELKKLRGGKIGLIPQNPSEALNPLLKNGKQITETIAKHQKVSRKERRSLASRLLKALNFVNPELAMEQYPHQLSGGMKQRVLAAIGISGNPALLIADEPTKGLDALARLQVIDMLKELVASTGAAILIITHDIQLAFNVCDELAVMYAGEIIEKGTAKGLFKNPCHPYLKALIASHPKHGMKVLKGTSPSLINLPKHCRFYERCAKAKEECRSKLPAIKEVMKGHKVRCSFID